MLEDLWEGLLSAVFGSLFEIKQELWDTVSGMYYETLYSYFNDSAGPLSDAFTALVMASYVGVVVAAGIILISHETLQTKYTLRELLPRLVIAILLVGLAKEITWQVYATHLSLADAFTITDRVASVTCENFPEGSATPIEPAECEGHESVMRSEFANHAFMVATGPGAEDPVGLVDIGMQLVSIWVYLTLVVIFVMRNIAWFCVLIMAPLALACHSLPQLERFAHYWWRLLGACLASAIGQCALIWIYHQLDGTIQFDDSGDVKYLDDYNLLLFYLVLITWLMWKLHKAVFQLARGTHMKMPGSKFLAFLATNRLMNGRSSGRKSGKSRGGQRRRGRDDDDGASSGARPARPRPVRRYRETEGQRDYASFRNQADAFHAEHGTKPGGPVSVESSNGETADKSARPTGPVPSPSEVADRIEHRKTVLEQPDEVREWEQFRNQADAFHAHRAEIARRTQRDTGARRKRDRSADAVDALADVPRRLQRRDAVDGTGRRETPRRAAGRVGETAMPRAHRGDPDWVLTILPKYRVDDRTARPTGDGGSDSEPGGERS
jgi:hypothetical protein